MYKLYLTLDNEKGNKIERVYEINPETQFYMSTGYIQDMIDSMNSVEKKNKDEELKVEANRLVSEKD